MWLSLKRIFRRATKHPLLFTAECDKRELSLWHNLADVSDYMSSLDEGEKADRMSDIFNSLAQKYDWPVADKDCRVTKWLSGMFDGAHKFGPMQPFVRHTRFLAREKYDENAVWATGREFVLDNSHDIGAALKGVMK